MVAHQNHFLSTRKRRIYQLYIACVRENHKKREYSNMQKMSSEAHLLLVYQIRIVEHCKKSKFSSWRG